MLSPALLDIGDRSEAAAEGGTARTTDLLSILTSPDGVVRVVVKRELEESCTMLCASLPSITFDPRESAIAAGRAEIPPLKLALEPFFTFGMPDTSISSRPLAAAAAFAAFREAMKPPIRPPRPVASSLAFAKAGNTDLQQC